MGLSALTYDEILSQSFKQQKFKDILNFPPSFEDLGLVGQRILLHYQGMSFAAMGAPHKALLTYNKALKYGSNVKLLRDLACTYYQLEDFQRWKNSYLNLEAELKLNQGLLSHDSDFTCRLTLAKFFEEEGRLGQALRIYQDLTFKNGFSTKNREFYLLSPQLLRIQSLLPTNQEMSQLYTQLMSCDLNSISDYIKNEISHSLMLAELNLIGLEHAWVRVKKILTNKNLPEYEAKLFYIDFLEEALLRNSPQEQINEYVSAGQFILNTFSKYENVVYSIASSKEADRSQSLSEISREVPLGGYLRLLILLIVNTKNQDLKLEYQNKFALIISGLENPDRAFWIKRWQKFDKSSRADLLINEQEKFLVFLSKRIDISRKKLSFEILKLLANKSHWTTDEIMDRIWKDTYSPESFNKLRMSVHRTNHLLEELTTIQKCIHFHSDHIRLNPELKIHLSN